MVTLQEADDFLRHVLDIPSYESEFKENKLELLNKIIYRHYQKNPFNNLDLLSRKPADRHIPTHEEIKESMFAGRGGLCYTVNVFLCWLLKALGYDINFTISSISTPNNHMISIVRNVAKEGDLYIVEGGVGYPSFQAIPVDFEPDKESKVYEESFLEYKYLWREGRVWRMHRRGELRPLLPNVPRQDLIGDWRRWYDVCLTPGRLEDYEAWMEKVYNSPDATPFHFSLRAIWFPEGKAEGFKDFNKLVEDPVTHKLVAHKLPDAEALKKAIYETFPQMSLDTISKAVDNWLLTTNKTNDFK